MKDKKLNQDIKYLTQMKELPPENFDETEGIPGRSGKSERVKSDAKTSESDELMLKNDRETDKEAVTKIKDEDFEDKIRLPFTVKDIILGIVNLICIVVLFVVLFKFPSKAKELKELRLERLKNEFSVSFEFSKVKESKAKSDELQKMFLNDAGVVDFVNELEKIKNEGGTIKSITFADQGPVKDRTGNTGIPVVIEFQGFWDAVDRDLQRLDNLPFLFRAARVEIQKPKPQPGQVEEVVIDPNVVIFKYGLILYYANEK